MIPTNEFKRTTFCLVILHLLVATTAFEVSGTSVAWIDLAGTSVTNNGGDRQTTVSVSFTNAFSETPDYVIIAIAGVRLTRNEFQVKLEEVSKTNNQVNVRVTAYDGCTLNRIGLTVFAIKNNGGNNLNLFYLILLDFMYAFEHDFHTHSNFSTFRDESGDRTLQYAIDINTFLNPWVFFDVDVYVFFSQMYFRTAGTLLHVEYSNARLENGKVKLDLRVKNGVKLKFLSGHILIVGKNKARSTLK